MNFKKIYIGEIIALRATESKTDVSRICNFFKLSEDKIKDMYRQKSLDTETLLKWSKLLEYDFFRIYSQHLILYSPPAAKEKNTNSKLPKFRRNIYTKEVIDFIVNQVESRNMTKNEVMEFYKIPKTTLYKWITKHKEQEK